jgi:hypothetical protein
MFGIVSSDLDRMEDVAAVFLADRYLTPKLVLRQHVGQQRRFMPAKSVIWPQPTRMGVRGSII